jgi:hypothetical protein
MSDATYIALRCGSRTLEFDGERVGIPVDGAFVAPPPEPGESRRWVACTIDLMGETADDLAAVYREVWEWLDLARQGVQADDMVHSVELLVRLRGMTSTMAFDVVDGRLILPDEAVGRLTLEHRWVEDAVLELECLPFARGAMQSRSFADVALDGTAVLAINDVPGDVPALTRWIITDTSASGVINRLMLGRMSRRRGADALDADLILDAVAQTPGASGSEAGTFGGARARITMTPAYKAVARVSRSGVDANGVFRLLARVRDSSNILSAPTNLRATPVVRTVTMDHESATADNVSDTTVARTIPAPASGNVVVAVVGWNSTTITASITAGMTAPIAAARVHNGAQSIQIFVGASDGSTSVEATFSSSVAGRYIEAYSFAGLSASIHASNGASGTSATFSTGSVTTARPCMLISGFQWTSSLVSPTAGSGWTQDSIDGTRAISAYSSAAPAGGTYSHTATASGSDPFAGVIVAIPYRSMTALLTLRVVALAATTSSAASEQVTVQIPQGHAIQLDWDAGSGTPTDHVVYANDGGGWDSVYTGSAATTYVMDIAPSSPNDPPTQATAIGAQVKARIALASAAQWFDLPPVGTMLGNSAWEWLDLGMATLPPIRAHEGGRPPAWTVEVQGRYLVGDLLGSQTLDVDAVALIPAMEDATVVEYPALNLGTKRQWVIDTRRDGAVSAYLRAVDGTGEHGGLHVANASGHQIAPGSNLVPVLGAIAGGVSANPSAAEVDVTVEFVPRYRFVTGQPS